jgi:hypothetical protein
MAERQELQVQSAGSSSRATISANASERKGLGAASRRARLLRWRYCCPHPSQEGLVRCERPTETRLRGWGGRTRTGESVRALSDWNCAITSPEIGASPAAETLRVQAAR